VVSLSNHDRSPFDKLRANGVAGISSETDEGTPPNPRSSASNCDIYKDDYTLMCAHDMQP
jgi:hypothetical protein